MATIPFRQNRAARRFMLMPLVDVIFLLLTFFMLSSQISPYAVLPVGAGAGEDAPEAAQAPAQGPNRPIEGLLIAVAPGAAQVNGEAMSFDTLARRAEAMRDAAESTAVVLPRRAASVQDVVTVIEILRRARFAKVSIRTRDAP